MRLACGLLCVAFGFFLATESRADTCGSPGNLVANCGFETGDFTSWTLSGNDVPLELNNLYGVEGHDPLNGINPETGSFQAFFADLVDNATTLQQTFATVANDTYTVSFFLAQDTPVGAGFSNAFSVAFGGVTLANDTDVPVEGYTEYSYNVTATSSSSVLSLKLGDDLGEFLLDDVSVVDHGTAVATPEPRGGLLMLAGIMGSVFVFRKLLPLTNNQ